METQLKSQHLPYLPVEILEEIFLRLPIKSLIRFRLLSKYWPSVIFEPRFQKQYHDLRLTQGPTSLVTAPSGFDVSVSHAFTGLDDHYDRDPGDALRDVIANRGFNLSKPKFTTSPPNPRLLGSWNGLVGFFNGSDRFILWNPCTEKSKEIIAPVSLHDDVSSLSLFGLCYDAQTDEYMAVIANYYTDPPRLPIEYRGQVEEKECEKGYLVSFKGEGKVEELLNCYQVNRMSTFDEQVGTIIDGVPYWINSENSRNIFYMDIQNKEFKEIQHPRGEKRIISGLGALHGELTVALGHQDRAEFEVWTLTKLGSQETWAKMFVIPEIAGLESYNSLSILGLNGDGEIVVDIDGNVILQHGIEKYIHNQLTVYSPSEKIFRQILASRYGTGVSKATYIPTLLSPLSI